jgi:hypothetical protein
MAQLALSRSDVYCGVEEFSGADAKAIVLLDQSGRAEHIHLRAYAGRDLSQELLALDACLKDANLRLFDPRADELSHLG